jgi:hypothetical protein
MYQSIPQYPILMLSLCHYVTNFLTLQFFFPEKLRPAHCATASPISRVYSRLSGRFSPNSPSTTTTGYLNIYEWFHLDIFNMSYIMDI